MQRREMIIFRCKEQHRNSNPETMIEVRPLQTELQKIAIKDLNEDPNRIEEAFNNINEWLQKQPHLNIRKDDQIMIAFLRGCKWNIQKVKEKLDAFYSIKPLIPDFFMNRDPFSEDVQKVLKAGIVFPLPIVEGYLGPIILIYNLKKVNAEETPAKLTNKLLLMTLDILIKENDNFVVSGVIVLSDHDECPVSYYMQAPIVLKNYVKCFQNIYPVRIKGYIGFNSSSILETVYNNLVKPFLSKKNRERTHIVSLSQTKEFLLNTLPQNVLPEEYGGTNGSLRSAAEEWKKKVESYREWFLEDPNYFTNESLRIGQTNLFEEGIGVEGTFRNLLID